jgi:DNA polymerase-3 subunit delta'
MEQLRHASQQQRLPHALLIHDVPGGGGEQLAIFAAQVALCRETPTPCGKCRDCLRVRAATRAAPGTHPDLHRVSPSDEPGKESDVISVKQIRVLGEELQKTGHGGSNAVAIIDPADTMTATASNALLKTLEEPRAGVTLILLTAAPSHLLATIRSRCTRIRIKVPQRAQIVQWLTRERGTADWNAVLGLLGDAPLLAATADVTQLLTARAETQTTLNRGLQDPAAIASQATAWSKPDQFELRLACIENWITTRLDIVTGQNADGVAMRPSGHLPASGATLNIAALLRAYDAARELKLLAAKPINRSLALEQLLWQLSR